MQYILDTLAVGGFILFAFSGWTTILFCTFLIGYCFFHQWCQGARCSSSERLQGKTVVITGASSGIGKETATILSSRGARVILGCKDMNKGQKTVDSIKSLTQGQVVLYHLDLSSLKSVREFSKKVLETEKHGVSILINNAAHLSKGFEKTEDGNELTFQVNHLGHFLLTNLLLPLLKASAPSRIINVSSKTHSNTPKGFDFANINSNEDFQSKDAYNKSKLANLLFSKELANRLKGTGVTVYAVHPGVTNTSIMKSFMPELPGALKTGAELAGGILSKTSESGAQTSVYCALDKDLEEESGLYYSECRRDDKVSSDANNEDLQKNLWKLSEKLVNLSSDEISLDKVRILDINEMPLPPLPADATPEMEEPQTIPKSYEKNYTVKEEVLSSKEMSGLLFDDAPEECNPEVITNIIESMSPVQETSKDEILGDGEYVATNEYFVKEKPLSMPQKADPIVDLMDIETPITMQESNPIFANPQHEEILKFVEDVPRGEEGRFIDEAFLPTMEGMAHEETEGSCEDKSILDDIKTFDKTSLAHLSEPREDNILPTKEMIEDEKREISKEVSKNQELFSEVQEELLKTSPIHLKGVDTVLKESLPDKYELQGEKAHKNVLEEISDFDSDTLAKVATVSPIEPQEFLKRETVMKEIEEFSPDSLTKTEPVNDSYLPSEADINDEFMEIKSSLDESKKNFEDVLTEVGDFKSSELKNVDTAESTYLPDKIDINVERGLKGVLEEVKTTSVSLFHVEHTKEPISPNELIKQEQARNNTLNNVATFDKSSLKNQPTDERSILPTSEDIELEKEIIKRDNLTRDVESFEKSSLKTATTEEKTLLPSSLDIAEERTLRELLEDIESFDSHLLKASEVKEPLSPSELAKQEIARDSVLQDLESYDKSNLTHSNTKEKVVLPDSATILEEKQRQNLLHEIEEFIPKQDFKQVAERLTGEESLKNESAHLDSLTDVALNNYTKLVPSELKEIDVSPEPKGIKEEISMLDEAKRRSISGSSADSVENASKPQESLAAALSSPATLDEQRTSSDEWVKLEQTSTDLLG